LGTTQQHGRLLAQHKVPIAIIPDKIIKNIVIE